MLHEGKILMVQTPEEIQSSTDPILQQFITGCVEGPIRYH
jgi:ABC-type transporter Mla maintaining outer membrane lipid asymmetry ATPase subunit MlaF